MPYDEAIAERIRKSLKGRSGFTERKMFGGIAFMLNGNMCCGVIGKDLMLRLGNQGAAKALKEPHARKMDFTGKPLKSMVYVSPAGYGSDKDLHGWIRGAVDYAESLPPK